MNNAPKAHIKDYKDSIRYTPIQFSALCEGHPTTNLVNTHPPQTGLLTRIYTIDKNGLERPR